MHPLHYISNIWHTVSNFDSSGNTCRCQDIGIFENYSTSCQTRQSSCVNARGIPPAPHNCPGPVQAGGGGGVEMGQGTAVLAGEGRGEGREGEGGYPCLGRGTGGGRYPCSGQGREGKGGHLVWGTTLPPPLPPLPPLPGEETENITFPHPSDASGKKGSHCNCIRG